MANKYFTKLRNKASAKLFKLADSINIRNKASKEMFKKAKGLKKGGRVGLKEGSNKNKRGNDPKPFRVTLYSSSDKIGKITMDKDGNIVVPKNTVILQSGKKRPKPGLQQGIRRFNRGGKA